MITWAHIAVPAPDPRQLGRHREQGASERLRRQIRPDAADGDVVHRGEGIVFSGDGRAYEAAAGTPSPGGGTYGTRASYTLRVVAPDFNAESLTIEDAFDYAANAAKSDSDATKTRGSQGVALMTDMDADRSVFTNVTLLGNPNPAVNSAAAFIDCWLDDHIGAKGWDRMSSVDSVGTRTWYEPVDARFYEYGTTGPGAVASASRRVMSAEEAKRYTPALVLSGWVPRH